MWLLLACTPPSGPGSSHGRPDTSADTARDTDTPTDTSPDTDSPADTSPDSGGDTSSPRPGGPCAVYADGGAVAHVQDPALDELSGLAASRLNPGVLWTHEDSGGAPELYALDAATGETLATLTLEGVENTDWEDIALGACDAGWCLYVGDIGDLGAGRSDFAVLVVDEPLLDGTAALSATPEVRPFTYPGDPEDAEGLAVTAEGEPIVVTKRADATAGIYGLPEGATVLEPLAEIATGAPDEDLTARATAADLWLDPPRLLVRTYLHLWEVPFDDPSAPGEPTALDFVLELQGEAVAWDPLDGGFWQVAEGVGPALNHTGCAE